MCSEKNLSAKSSYYLDLDELIAVAQDRNTKQRAGHRVAIELPTDHLPGGLQVFLPLAGDVHRRLDYVCQTGTSSPQRDCQIRHDLLGLSRDVTTHPYSFAACVKRACARGEDKSRHVLRHGGIVQVVSQRTPQSLRAGERSPAHSARQDLVVPAAGIDAESSEPSVLEGAVEPFDFSFCEEVEAAQARAHERLLNELPSYTVSPLGYSHGHHGHVATAHPVSEQLKEADDFSSSQSHDTDYARRG